MMRVLFFATPVFWLVEGSGVRAMAAQYNPLAHLLSLAREPLLGAPMPLDSLALMTGFAVLSWVVGVFVFSRTRVLVAGNL